MNLVIPDLIWNPANRNPAQTNNGALCRGNTDLIESNHISHRIYTDPSGTLVPVDNQLPLSITACAKLNRQLDLVSSALA